MVTPDAIGFNTNASFLSRFSFHMYLVLPRSPQTCERSSNRSRDAALTRFEWSPPPLLPVEANQRDLDEMAPSVDSLHARDTPIQWIRADLG